MPRDWDQYYSAGEFRFEPAPLLVEAADLLRPGRALDLACGPGRNALYLAKLGWDVIAVDASKVAIALLGAQSSGLPLRAHVADLEKHEFTIAPAAYDLICDFFYLQRDLFPAMRAGLRPGGVFAGAIHLFEPDRPSDFSMHPGELRAEFHGWKILYYSEGAEHGHPRRAARILARNS